MEIEQQLDKQRRQVDFDTYDIIVQQLISMVESQTIDVAPLYQRRFRWDSERKSQLIESVFLGVPVPSLFMATNKDSTWEVVDGVQRLSTLVEFCGSKEARDALSIKSPLKLTELEKLSEMNGKSFDQLPETIQLQFLRRPIKVITLSDKSDRIVRFDLFERLNTGGITLTDQEIRSCVYRGRFSNFLEEMAEDDNFKAVVKLTPKQNKDGTNIECVLRFFAFYHNYTKFDHSVSGFLNEYMEKSQTRFDYNANKKLFAKTFEELAGKFHSGIVRSPRKKRTPLNFYEGIAVGAALAVEQVGRLQGGDPYSWTESPELKKSTTGATNSRSMVAQRIEFWYPFTQTGVDALIFPIDGL